MEQEIIDLITDYAQKTANCMPNDRVIEGIKRNAPSFKRLVENCGYVMKPSINDEGTCVVEFCSPEGKVYTTYPFLGILATSSKK